MVELQKQIFKTLGLDQEDHPQLDPDKYGNHNFFMIINQDSGPKLQINFNEVQKLTPDDFKAIREQIENNYANEQQLLLKEYTVKRHGKQ